MAPTIAEFMGQDHDRLDEIFKQFQETKSKDFRQGKEHFKAFLTGLQRHIVWEEDILFPIFEAHADMVQGHGPTAIMRIEHKQIKQFLDEIHQKIASEDRRTENAERGLLEVLTAHNVKEEKILYPWIDTTVSEKERVALITQMQNLPPEKYAHCCE